MTLTQVLDLVSKVGFGGLLVAILYGSYKRIWVWGSELKKVEAERDEWKDLAMSGTHVANALTDFAIQQRLQGESAAAKTGRQRLAEEANIPPPARRKVRPP